MTSPRKTRNLNVYITTKRVADVAFSSVLLVLLSPVAAVIALLVRLRMGKPVVFRQDRLGIHGKPFTMFKFRTLTDERGPDGHLLPDERRMTPLGQTLRTYSLDEIPTIVNILRGEMSLVGPRPFLAQYLTRYTSEELERHNVRPGVTGWAQVNGRNLLTWEERIALDLWYVKHITLGIDLRILFKTIGVVLRHQDTSSEGHVSMPEFRPEA